MSAGNKELQKKIRGQIARRPLDISMINIGVVGTVVYITGVLRPTRGNNEMDLKGEMENVSKVLRGMSGVREVVWDVTLRS